MRIFNLYQLSYFSVLLQTHL